MTAVSDSPQFWERPQPIKFATHPDQNPVRREGAEGEPGKFDIIQDPPGGVAAVEVEHVCVAVLPLALDGVIVREKRVSFKASVLIKSNSLSISGEDMKVKGLDGVTWVVV